LEFRSNHFPLQLFKFILNKQSLIALSVLPPNLYALFVSCKSLDLNAKLADIGMIPGSIWKIVNRLPFSGPLVLSNGPIRISVRREDAAQILMEVNS